MTLSQIQRDQRDWFGLRILPIDSKVADHWGRLLAQVGRPVPAMDSLLAPWRCTMTCGWSPATLEAFIVRT